MQKMPLWVRVLVIVGFSFALILPLVLSIINIPMIADLIPVSLRSVKDRNVSQRYSVRSDVPGYTLKLMDTSYLDYVTANMGIFGENTIVDPRFYRGSPDLKQHLSVSQVRFDLVPDVNNFLMAIPGENSFVGKGDYHVDGDTLIIQVSLDIAELTKNPLTKQYSLEDVYLRTAINMLYYAHGLSDPQSNLKNIVKIKTDIQEYLYRGLFVWPIKIERVEKL